MNNRAINTDLAVKIVSFFAIALIAAYTFYQLKMLIVCLILGVTIAAAIAPLAEAAEKRKIPRAITVIAVYLLGAAVYATLALLLFPAIREQWRTLDENIPKLIALVNSLYDKALNFTGSDSLAISLDDAKALGMKALKQALNTSAGLFGLIANTILTLFLSAYFVVEANKLWETILKWTPPNCRTLITPHIVPLANRMGGYIRGTLLVAIAVAVFLTVGFSILGLHYALVLGILAGVLNLVPYVGSLIACIFAVIIAFNQDPVLALAVIGIYVLEQWVESAFMMPFFLGSQADLHPLVVMFAIIIGGSLMGLPGAIISVPVASAVIYLCQEFYVKRFDETKPIIE